MIQQAHNAYNQKDFQTAFKLYGDLAEAGNPDAQASLGYMYQQGQGTAPNDAEALKWYI